MQVQLAEMQREMALLRSGMHVPPLEPPPARAVRRPPGVDFDPLPIPESDGPPGAGVGDLGDLRLEGGTRLP